MFNEEIVGCDLEVTSRYDGANCTAEGTVTTRSGRVARIKSTAAGRHADLEVDGKPVEDQDTLNWVAESWPEREGSWEGRLTISEGVRLEQLVDVEEEED